MESNTVWHIQRFKDFYYFKEGSWWVYQNLADTTIKDSLWVNFSAEDLKNNTVQNRDYSEPYCFEVLTMHIQSKLNYSEPYFVVRQLALDFQSSPQDVFGTYYHYSSISPATSTYFHFEGDSMYSQETATGLAFRAIGDTTINNIAFSDLVSFYYPGIIKSIGLYKVLTFARNVGPVYYEEVNGSRWSLIRYNVVQ